jgi:hypothetical protein
VTIAPVGVPASSQALVSPATTAAPAPPPAASAAKASGKSGARRTEIKPGMSTDEVRQMLGEPESEVVFGDKTRWTYPGMTVVFAKGKVSDVQF